MIGYSTINDELARVCTGFFHIEFYASRTIGGAASKHQDVEVGETLTSCCTRGIDALMHLLVSISAPPEINDRLSLF